MKMCAICHRMTGNLEEHHVTQKGMGGSKKPWVNAETITVCSGTGGNTDLTSCHGLLHQRKKQVWLERKPGSDSVMIKLHATKEGADLLERNFKARIKSEDIYWRYADDALRDFSETLRDAQKPEGVHLCSLPMSQAEADEIELRVKRERQKRAEEYAALIESDPHADRRAGGWEDYEGGHGRG